MPALTVRSVTKALSGYVRPDEDIVAKLNMVMPRLYAMGMWRDLLFDWSINTTNKYFSLPEGADGLLGVLMNDSPVEAQAQWHDYRISGYASDGPAPVFGVVDDGWHPVKEDLNTGTSTDTFELDLVPVSPNITLPDEGQVIVTYTRSNGATGQDILSSSGATGSVSDITSVDSVIFNDLHEKVDLVATNTSNSNTVTLARMIGDGVARYRRFRFENSSSQTRNVKLLLKRAWEPVQSDDDIIYLGNLNAIKHGLLGMVAEDNADLERAQYHWAICDKLLGEELDAARGAAKPKLTVKPVGNQINIPNII